MNPRDVRQKPDAWSLFEVTLSNFPEGYQQGWFIGHRWGVTLKRSSDGKRTWLYAEELAGSDIVSFNHYRLSATGAILKPCEMSSDKVIAFVLGFKPDAA